MVQNVFQFPIQSALCFSNFEQLTNFELCFLQNAHSDQPEHIVEHLFQRVLFQVCELYEKNEHEVTLETSSN